jgi:NADH:ubiquinone oxidoreductase subunit 2 (subunit N)
MYAIIIVVASLLSVLYYFRIVRYLTKPDDMKNNFKLDYIALSGILFVIITLFAMLFASSQISMLSSLVFKIL